MFAETTYPGLGQTDWQPIPGTPATTPGGLVLIPPGSASSSPSSDCLWNCFDASANNESDCIHQCASVGGYSNTAGGSNILRRILGGGQSGDPALAAQAQAGYGTPMGLLDQLPSWWPIAAVGLLMLISPGRK